MRGVAVIGAGLAGLMAANHLKEQGIPVTVIEARDRLGGRVHTLRDWGLPVDLGAQWIHGKEGNPVTELCREHQVLTLDTDYKDIIFFDRGRQLTREEQAKVWREIETWRDQLQSTADAIQRDVSVEYAVNQLLRPEQKGTLSERILHWTVAWYLEIENGADRADMSFQHAEVDKCFPGGDCLLPYGYDQMIQGLADPLDIRLEEVVTEVIQEGEGVRVRTTKDERLVDCVICTVPLGVLQSEKIRFHPAFTQVKKEALSRLKMGLLAKVFLKFPYVFWDPSSQYIGAITEEELGLPLFVNHAKNHQIPVLEGCTAGDLGRRIEKMDPQEAGEIAMETLREMYGSEIPQPEDVVTTQWSNDPFALGSYSYSPINATDDLYDAMAAPLGERIFFAGEATSRWYTGTAHGACLSGVREAERAVKLLK